MYSDLHYKFVQYRQQELLEEARQDHLAQRLASHPGLAASVLLALADLLIRAGLQLRCQVGRQYVSQAGC